jgi:hypothetical protein
MFGRIEKLQPPKKIRKDRWDKWFNVNGRTSRHGGNGNAARKSSVTDLARVRGLEARL